MSGWDDVATKEDMAGLKQEIVESAFRIIGTMVVVICVALGAFLYALIEHIF